MSERVMMFTCIGILLLLPCLIFGADSKLLDVLDGPTRHGVSLSRSVELLIHFAARSWG